MILDTIKGPEDIKKLTYPEMEELASEIRSFLIEKISHTGGHLASNLGVVELTIALYRVFNFPTDKSSAAAKTVLTSCVNTAA